MQDAFDEIAFSLLISDAELALTFIQIGLGRPEGERQTMAFRRAVSAYHSIYKSIRYIRVNDTDLERLETLLQEIKAKLGETSCTL